jgi:hypothetical protein
VSRSAKTFTPKQGQYLAFIHLYTRLHRRPPAETDMQQYFRVSPPSVHQMVLTLERAGFHQKATEDRPQHRTARRSATPARATLTPDPTCQNHCAAVLVAISGICAFVFWLLSAIIDAMVALFAN